jgi:hypothetical protein
MKIALMQPYFMPYIGYFQLINAVDKFIFFDNANFIKQGWINRNNILLNQQRHRFYLPIKNISSNRSIAETTIAEQPHNWQKKLLKKVAQAYQKAPFFDTIYPNIEKILRGCAGQCVADVAIESIEQTLGYIGVEKTLIRSEGKYNNKHLKLTPKVIDICQKEGATTYINAFGGQNLFCRDCFKKQEIELFFIKPVLKTYTQLTPDFVGGLSILDVLMHNDPTTIKSMMNDYNLI